jgi:hypothetical protein
MSVPFDSGAEAASARTLKEARRLPNVLAAVTLDRRDGDVEWRDPVFSEPWIAAVLDAGVLADRVYCVGPDGERTPVHPR